MRSISQLAWSLSLASLLTTTDAFWRMNCGVAQTGRVDPIISPNAISGHVHLLSGASNINTTSTFQSLQAASCTSCSIQKDKSAYWTPLLYYQRGDGSFVNVPNDGTVVYYLGRGEDRRNIVPFPPGLQMVSGDPTTRSYDSSKMTYGDSKNRPRPVADRVSFACINYAQATPETPNMATTNCPNGLRAQVHFPSCWDGVNLYKADQSHMAYLSQIDNGVCPPTHPKLFPHLFYEIYYFPNRIDTSDGGRFVFAQGDTTGYGFHGGKYICTASRAFSTDKNLDFLNAWDNQVLTDAIAQCINDVDSGNISECPPLYASQDEYFGTNCPEQPALVNEQVKGVLSKLPGCNEVTAGPAKAPQGVCPTQPSLNSGAGSDGQVRTVPTAGETTLTVGTDSVAQYKGCYVEANGARALSKASKTDGTGMSTSMCGAFCMSKGFSVFGTEYSKECYCGETIATSTAPQSECAMLCAGNRTEYCGGPNRLSVWSVTSSAPPNSTPTPSSVPSSPPSGPAVSGANYVGCYSDNTGGRTLTGSYTTDNKMTLELCAQTAQAKNLKYFGLEYAGECFAGNSILSSASQIAASRCSMKCKGNQNQDCGGPDALSMFQNTLFVQPGNPVLVNITATSGGQQQYEYKGCYTDGVSGRSLGGSGSYSTSDASMTVEKCAQACYSKGYSYAGVEYSRECFCNNIGITNGGGAAPGGDADCAMLCAGSKAEYCGGPNRLNLYQLKGSGGAQRERRHDHMLLHNKHRQRR